MGKRGPPKTPTQTLSNRGSWLAARRPNEPAPAVALPSCPAWVREDAQKHWPEIGKMLVGMGVMAEPYALGLALLVEAVADYIERAKAAENEQLVVETEKGYVAHPIHKLKSEAWARVANAAKQFGLTPATIADVSVNKPKQEDAGEYRTA